MFIIVGLCIHICFLFSIFDIYFKSPRVSNVPPYEPQHDPVADRLVLFVVDGLRAESFLNYSTMSYLRSVANSHGKWGISYTRVPTESRPGHVAMLAGFYEDPSAIAKGWKANPVDFDSVFNQTLYTWAWGSYDILDIFTKGSSDDHISGTKFDSYDETFSTDKNTTLVDNWVFENAQRFFDSAKLDKVLLSKLKEKKIAFFLYLLGADTSGHTHKPKTQNFLTTIRFVDEGIKHIEQIIRNFYGDDGKTTFLMTSDHGMTDWGSHGAGDDHETQTPYVLWGAGVKQASQVAVDPQTNGMSLEHRFDINQADLAPLMSTILSIPVPVNSVGQLRTELLNMSLANEAKAIYSNSRQLAAQYNKKRSDIEANAISMLYQPYEPFTKNKYEELIKFTEKILENRDYENLILLSKKIMNLSLEGLNYYHDYYQKPLLLLVTLSFMGWIVCLLKKISKRIIEVEHSNLNKKMPKNLILLSKKIINLSLEGLNYYHNYYKKPLLLLVTLSFMGWIVCLLKKISEQKIDVEHSNLNKKMPKNMAQRYFFYMLFIVLSTFATLFVFVQSLPVQYYLYFLMPIFLWWYAISEVEVWSHTIRQLKRHRRISTVWMEGVCYCLGSMSLGLSFTYRWMLSIPLLGMGLWPFLSSTRSHLSRAVLLAWPLSCLLLSIFSFMPVVGKDACIELVISAGSIWLFLLTLYFMRVAIVLYYNNEESKKEMILIAIQTVLLILALHNIFVQSRRYQFGTPVSYVHQTIAWIIAASSFILPLMCSKRLVCRLMAVNTSLLTLYLLLSVAHEGLFVVALILNITCWIFIEFRLLHLDNVTIAECSFDRDIGETSKTFTTIERSISNQDFRRAFFFITYLILAFFGTGNIASLNSFEVRWVTCFITSFQPYIMIALVLLKTLAPFLIVACGFRAVQHLTKAPAGYLNIIVLIYSNIMGIQLLYYVKNTGSWLEIGTSISQFVIVQVITLFIVVINQLAKVLTNGNIGIYPLGHSKLVWHF